MKKLNKKGFTLIELLAVIVILGLLMAIAIPSVTRYITQSRKKTLVSSIDSFITAATTMVNNNEFGAMSNDHNWYYIPVSNVEKKSCISLEKGGTDPFGNWTEAYVVVNYDRENYSYNYFFTFYDDAGYGMKLTKSDKIDPNDKEQIKNPTNFTMYDIYQRPDTTHNLSSIIAQISVDYYLNSLENIVVLSPGTCHVDGKGTRIHPANATAYNDYAVEFQDEPTEK